MESGKEKPHVVKEIPVYLTSSPNKLYLLQQPLRPSAYEIDKTKILNAQYKPEQEKIQLSMEINTQSKKYDREKGEILVDQDLDEDDDTDSNLVLNKFVLESSTEPVATNSTRYIVGIICEDRVNLVPIKNIVQMKAAFPYLKIKDKKSRVSSGKGDAGDVTTETEEEDNEEEKVTVKFSKDKKEDKSGKEKQKSFHSMKKANEDAPWINLDFNPDGEEALRELTKIPPEKDSSIYITSQQDYLNLIFPKYKEPTLPK